MMEVMKSRTGHAVLRQKQSAADIAEVSRVSCLRKDFGSPGKSSKLSPLFAGISG